MIILWYFCCYYSHLLTNWQWWTLHEIYIWLDTLDFIVSWTCRRAWRCLILSVSEHVHLYIVSHHCIWYPSLSSNLWIPCDAIIAMYIGRLPSPTASAQAHPWKNAWHLMFSSPGTGAPPEELPPRGSWGHVPFVAVSLWFMWVKSFQNVRNFLSKLLPMRRFMIANYSYNMDIISLSNNCYVVFQ